MRKLIIQKNKKDTKIIEGVKLGETHILSVGWECDPLEVQKVVNRYGGMEYDQIIFETVLPENKYTYNNAYIITRVRQD